MSDVARCPKCGAALPLDAPQGICPKCLMALGFESGPSGPAAKPAAETGPFSPQSAAFVPPPAAELGKLFPQLEVLELIGQGGMGAVYKARQKNLERLVALKILPPAQDLAFAERFRREARALSLLNHPHIVAVYDFGQVDGLYYFLMEFVDGVNLRQMTGAGKITPQQALAIVPQICAALQFAHEEGIVHRDIKPENILVDRKGQVKIADFGLAKLLGKTSGDLTLTRPQQVMGTPHYMAPEQFEGAHDVDHRADIYSLGVVFYELLTGELPLGKFAPPSHKVQIDVRIDEVVLHALEKDRERRYQKASDVKTDVERISSGKGSPVGSGPNKLPSEEEMIQQGILINKLGYLLRLQKQKWWVVPFMAVCLFAVLGIINYDTDFFIAFFVNGFLICLPLFIGFRWVWKRRIAATIQWIIKNHPQEVASLGGEILLRDPVGVEGFLQAKQRAVQHKLIEVPQVLPAPQLAPASAPAGKGKSDSGAWVCAVVAVILFVPGVVVPAIILGMPTGIILHSHVPLGEPEMYLFFFVFQGLAFFFGLLGFRHRLGFITAIMAILLMVVYVCSWAVMYSLREYRLREQRAEERELAAASQVGDRFIRELVWGDSKATLELLSDSFRDRLRDKGGNLLDAWERYLEQKPDYKKLRMYDWKSLPAGMAEREGPYKFSYEVRFTKRLRENEAEEVVIHLDLVDKRVDGFFFSVTLKAAATK